MRCTQYGACHFESINEIAWPLLQACVSRCCLNQGQRASVVGAGLATACTTQPAVDGRQPTLIDVNLSTLRCERCVQDRRQSEQEQQQQAPAELPLFSVNKNALKGDEEMRRMFGRDVVQMRHQEDEAADLGRPYCTQTT